MSIHIHSTATIYCDGAVHAPLEFSTGADNPMTRARDFARRQGWVFKRDGRVLCPRHKEGK